MRFRLAAGLLALLLIALMLGGFGCNKVTGGGWILDEGGNRVTFGFNAQPVDSDGDGIVDAAKGEFQLVDHSAKPSTRIHGTFTSTPVDTSPVWSIFEGTCSINGEDGHTLLVFIQDLGEPGPDSGDYIYVEVDGNPEYQGVLGGGNLQVHKN